MYTLLETCLERLDVFEFITHMESGLKVSNAYNFAIIIISKFFLGR